MNARKQPLIDIVVPTFHRPDEVRRLLENIAGQSLMPRTVIIVDGADPDNRETEDLVATVVETLPFEVRYLRNGGGTAIQRNHGIENTQNEFVALIDDDVRLAPDFLARIADVFRSDIKNVVGGVVGYRTNQHFAADKSERWRWYRRLGLLATFEPGRYDMKCGYPINNNMQPPFSGVRTVDFMTTACAVWRREVFESGLRFDSFFRDYGVLEDAHFSLRAGRQWQLLQCGDAHCLELHSPNGRVNRQKIGFKSVVNYYFVFKEIAGPLNAGQKFRFWRFQAFELVRVTSSAIRRKDVEDIHNVVGRIKGILAVLREPFPYTADRNEL